MKYSPTVFVVDDDPALLSSLQQLIESVNLSVQTFRSPDEFLARYESDQPGCLVLDLRMPNMSGLDLQEELRRRNISLPVIFLTAYGDVYSAVRAMKHDALDFLEKPVSNQVLLEQINEALRVDADARAVRQTHELFLAQLDRLSSREQEVLDQVVAGQTSKQIAQVLGISAKTIEYHRSNIMRKLEVDSVVELANLIQAGRLAAKEQT